VPLPVKPLSGRPLFATAADAELYVSLPDIEQRLERAVDRGLNTLIIGDRGSGKTTRSISTGRSRAASWT
jgi:hypothetical protein